MLRKKISLLLAVIIAAGAVSACSGTNGQNNNAVNDNPAVSSDSAGAENENSSQTDVNDDESNSASESQTSSTEDESFTSESIENSASQTDGNSSQGSSENTQGEGSGNTSAATEQSSRQSSAVNSQPGTGPASEESSAHVSNNSGQNSQESSQSKSSSESSGTKSQKNNTSKPSSSNKNNNSDKTNKTNNSSKTNNQNSTNKNTNKTNNTGKTNNQSNTNKTNNTSKTNNQSNTNKTNNTGKTNNQSNTNKTNNTGKTNNQSSTNKTNNTGKTNNQSSTNKTNNTGKTNNQSSTNKTNNTGKTNNQSSNNANVSVGDNNLYNSIFNLANKVQVKLTVSTSEMNKLQADYKKYKRFDSKSPIYRKASLTITVNGQSYSMNEVGIRLKGNMSLSPVYDKNGNLNLAHYKLSFNETFDKKEYYGSEAKVWASKAERKARKNRRFATLKKMDLKWNSCYDDTFVREIYAAKMFRDNGVIVQNIGLAQTVFNGNNYGVMKIYEPVDEIMLARFLPQSALGGDLYKCGWTTQPCNYVQNQVTYGVDDKDTGRKYNFNLKTNEKSSNHSSLKKLLSTLASRPDRYAFSSVIDTGYLAKFLAASYFAGDPDDIRNNYNNHYIYFRKDNGKAVFIPYDNDRTLGITYGYNPDGTGMTKPSPYSEMACGARQSQANPVINYGILGSKAFVKSEYTAALKRIADSGIMNVNNFNTYYNLAMNNYNSVVTPSVSFANQSQAFRFSLDGKYTSGDRRNMSFAVYSEKIMKTYHSYVR